MGRPSTYANSVANSVIYKVSSVPSHSSAPYSLKNSAIVFTPLCLSLIHISATEETFFKGVYKLPAAHYFVYENGKMDVRRFWD